MKKTRKRAMVLAFVLLSIASPIFAEYYPVEFVKVSESIIIHRSYDMYAGHKTPSNGLIVVGTKSVVLIDTAWNNQETDEILEYIHTAIQKDIAACIITHFHQDRAGGLDSIQAKGISIYMTEKTGNFLQSKYPYTKPNNGLNSFDSMTLVIEDFGPAHTKDNIIVYLPTERILFGGCLIKSMESKSIGNIADADVRNWPKVISALIKKYTNKIEIVIPGHGDFGGPELLQHTLQIVK